MRRFPMVPGIDLAGVVEHSDSPSYAPGDRVLVAWVNNHTDPIVVSKVVSS